MKLKEKIKIARKKAGLSQEQLGEAIDVSDKSVSAYEQGRSTPPLRVLKEIAAATKYSLSYFIEEDTTLGEIMTKMARVEKELKEIRELVNKVKKT